MPWNISGRKKKWPFFISPCSGLSHSLKLIVHKNSQNSLFICENTLRLGISLKCTQLFLQACIPTIADSKRPAWRLSKFVCKFYCQQFIVTGIWWICMHFLKTWLDLQIYRSTYRYLNQHMIFRSSVSFSWSQNLLV